MVADTIQSTVGRRSAAPVPAAVARARAEQRVLLVLFFASGFAGLVYQVCWLRQLGLLLGSTAYAASTTLVIFFSGLALGSWWWGRRAAALLRPLRAYAGLEVGIALASLSYFALLGAYHSIYGSLFNRLFGSPVAFLAAKALLAMTMLLPAAVLMGGTLPVIGQYLVRRNDETATTATLLYGVNTAGAACGALAAGFLLPAAIGYRGAYATAMTLNVVVALVAWSLDRGKAPVSSSEQSASPAATGQAAVGDADVSLRASCVLALLSGFATLCLQVLWTKMFAQVLHNSVYSFAAILVVFLVSLALGSAIAHRLCRGGGEPRRVLVALLSLAGVAVAAVPFVFHGVTGGLYYVAAEARWWAYVATVFGTVAVVLMPAVVLMGTVFPYTWKTAESRGLGPGETIGTLVAINTLGSILGAGLAGFVLLPTFGLWASVKTMGLLYLAAAAVLAQRGEVSFAWRVAPIAATFLFATVLDPAGLRLVRTDASKNEIIYETWEGAHGVVAVVRRGEHLRTKVDNYYSLGGTAAATYERTQADLPLIVHGAPQSVFFLGLGSGITAGAAVAHPLEKIVVAELIPEVVEASRRYFHKYTNGLFDDARVRVVAEDGRNYLSGMDETYDVVVADLFIPWKSGAGSLYTVEHFTTVRDRLNEGGLFAQWLPLYQLSKDEFFVIARTMLEVFPQVTLWRGDFNPGRPIAALVGHQQAGPLDVEALVQGFRRRKGAAGADRQSALATTALFYAGNVTADRDRYAEHIINTDDWPVIEFSAPITQREVRGKAGSWFVDRQLETYYAELARVAPPRGDPYLAELDDDEIGFVEGGRHLFAAKVFQRLEDADRSAEHMAAYAARMPDYMVAGADQNDHPPAADSLDEL